MKSSQEYWKERALKRAREAYLSEAPLTAKLMDEYERAARNIRREISEFYAKYAGKYGLTYEQAVKLLNKKELQEWRGTLEDYVNAIRDAEDDVMKRLLTAELDALSANSRISRLDALLGQIQLTLNELFDRGVAEMKQFLGDQFVEGYYQKCYDIQNRVGFFSEINKIAPEMIENVVSYPWSGAMFSERLWQNRNALVFNTREILTQGLIQGKSIVTMSKALSEKMGQSYKVAERLIRTESTHIHAEADRKAYEEAGVEEYEYMATLEARTCAVCGDLDGKHFKMEDAETGVNYPPIHPNCRCTTVEWDPEDELDWYESGQPMPRRTTYSEWYERQTVKNGQGSVEVARLKLYNSKEDTKQFKGYRDRLGDDAPGSFEDFQKLKYSQPEEWADLKKHYAYRGRVPEATAEDYRKYRDIRATGIYGTVRVPAEKIDLSGITFDAEHSNKKHDATFEDAISYIENAIFTIKRKRWNGTYLNFHAKEGASYFRLEDKVISTAFKKKQFDETTKRAMEAYEHAEKDSVLPRT